MFETIVTITSLVLSVVIIYTISKWIKKYRYEKYGYDYVLIKGYPKGFGAKVYITQNCKTGEVKVEISESTWEKRPRGTPYKIEVKEYVDPDMSEETKETVFKIWEELNGK